MLIPSYSELLLILAAAVSLLMIAFVLRRHWLSHPLGLQKIINQKDQQGNEHYSEYLLPLLVYEERFPSFGKVISLVLEHFPMRRFMGKEEFRSAMVYLRDAAFQSVDPTRVAVSMAVIIRTMLQDPEVEYRCRKQLPNLVNQFLEEIDPFVGSKPLGTTRV
ncbi:MAG: hypothetical protein HY645_01365 [Acidobacteria bacterium]|nr:hypothetical protein [Acidobacteriota bacterium]